MTPAETKLATLTRLQVANFIDHLRDVRFRKPGAVERAETDLSRIECALRDALTDAIDDAKETT